MFKFCIEGGVFKHFMEILHEAGVEDAILSFTLEGICTNAVKDQNLFLNLKIYSKFLEDYKLSNDEEHLKVNVDTLKKISDSWNSEKILIEYDSKLKIIFLEKSDSEDKLYKKAEFSVGLLDLRDSEYMWKDIKIRDDVELIVKNKELQDSFNRISIFSKKTTCWSEKNKLYLMGQTVMGEAESYLNIVSSKANDINKTTFYHETILKLLKKIDANENITIRLTTEHNNLVFNSKLNTNSGEMKVIICVLSE
ncbi:hypothetical protein BEH94_01585 [Candidatus Altiarchaeales archaeon WOR_SM1_SCG]|nr:hypothetical protein BEH94_01585 [Candidatus Altiarchaeales archaeon WOR_SM1_SCG]